MAFSTDFLSIIMDILEKIRTRSSRRVKWCQERTGPAVRKVEYRPFQVLEFISLGK